MKECLSAQILEGSDSGTCQRAVESGSKDAGVHNLGGEERKKFVSTCRSN